MEEPEEVTPRNRTSTQHGRDGLLKAIEAAFALGMFELTLTTLPVAGANHIPPSYRYDLDATSRSPREALARTASIRSTRNAS